MEMPLIKEITLSHIIERLIRDFKYLGINKTIIGDEIFGGYKNLQRIQNGQKKITSTDCLFLFNKIKTLSGGTSEQFCSTIISWFPTLSVYKTEDELKNVISANLLEPASSVTTSLYPVLGIKSFLRLCLQNSTRIKSVNLVAPLGSEWLDVADTNELLAELSNNKIEINIIINSDSQIMHKILSTIQDAVIKHPYESLNDEITAWHKYEIFYPNITLCISDYPILRQMIIVEFENHTQQIFFYDFIYGTLTDSSSPHRWIPDNHPDFKFFKSEFEFLWDSAISYSKWFDQLPIPEELISPNTYLLIYPSHTVENHTSDLSTDSWIYSILSIEKNNSVTLKVNITDLCNFTEPLNPHCEYTYQGSLRLTRNSIFISLYDDDSREAINISLSRPLYEKERYLGIITGLSPTGQPVAFKCACIKEFLHSKLNYSVLSKLFSNHNREWDDSLMIIENQDLNLFYSDRIFID